MSAIKLMKNMLWMGMGVGVGFLCSKYNKDIMKTFKKSKKQLDKKSS